jgi:hypothetical protein
MDYDTDQFPIERDPYAAPEDHVSVSAGVSRGGVNGAEYQALRRENLRRVSAAKHCRQARTS